jgi:hypothetical protein
MIFGRGLSAEPALADDGGEPGLSGNRPAPRKQVATALKA